MAFGPLLLDANIRTRLRNKRRLDLWACEFNLLRVQISHSFRITVTDEILRAIGQTPTKNERHIDSVVFVRARHLKDEPAGPQLMQSLRGAGYVLIPQAKR
ncbi:hypothetical protein AQ914_04630 [Burkholderia pseudomallei]|nr:hypothetical protein AQ914_04630 [Burkholderia pseudomallei]